MLELCSYSMAPAPPQTGSPAWALGEGREQEAESSAQQGMGLWGLPSPPPCCGGGQLCSQSLGPTRGFLLLITTSSAGHSGPGSGDMGPGDRTGDLPSGVLPLGGRTVVCRSVTRGLLRFEKTLANSCLLPHSPAGASRVEACDVHPQRA